ncbi:MAG: FecR family protein [Elusimicrobiota bacterium]
MSSLILALLSLWAGPARAAAVSVPVIGVAAAVRGPVNATAPGQSAGRVVETGKPVYTRDHVVTGSEGRLQILLNDETSFSLGPNSDMILDEFVYDPASGAGKISASVAKGAFRFVTGKVARRDPDSMKVETPVATIGIRGTMVAGSASAEQATIVLIGPSPENNAEENAGGITVGNERGSVDIDRSGYGVTVRRGQAPSDPFRLTDEQLRGILDALSSQPKGKSEGDDEGGATSENSGQEAAQGRNRSWDALACLDAAMPDMSQFAAQTSIADGPSSWDQVRGLDSGRGQYVGSGSYTGSLTGTFTFSLGVDFGARTLGGAGSDVATTTGGSYTISAFNYDAFSGGAKVNLLPFKSADAFPTAATKMDLTLVNKDGIAAKQAVLDLTVTSSSFSTGSGSGTGTR